MNGNAPMAEPPDGVLSGEDVPRENEQHDIDETLIEEVMAMLKGRGKPYSNMNETELEEKAVETIREHGVDL
jgi:hypothetical protein